MSIFWTCWLAFFILMFAVGETWAIKKQKMTLSRYVWTAGQNFPLILALAGMNEPPLSIDALEKMVANWGHSIQFSAPRGSIKDAEALLSDVAPLFLRQARRVRVRGAPPAACPSERGN